MSVVRVCLPWGTSSMGVDIAQYRARIGLYTRYRIVKIMHIMSVSSSVIYGAALIILLILLQLSGDIETNPGPTAEKNISIWHCNVCGFNSNRLRAMCHVFNTYDIIAITETHLSTESDIDLVQNNYLPIFRRDRPHQSWGGVALYVSNTLVAKRQVELEVDEQEILCVEICTGKIRLLVCVCYRPPNANVSFWDDLQSSLDLANQAGFDNIILIGDLNSHPGTYNGNKLEFLSASNNLKILIKEPTRITSTTSTILDQIIVSDHLQTNTTIVGPHIDTSDHCEISCYLNVFIPNQNAYKRIIWDYTNADWDGFNASIRSYDWNICWDHNNINRSAELWTNSFLNLARQHIPNKTITVRPWDKPWYTNALRSLKRKRDRLFRYAKNNNWDIDMKNSYSQCRNEYVRALEEAQTEFYLKQVHKINTGKPGHRNWWQAIKPLLRSKTNSTIPALKNSSGQVINDTKMKAQLLNSSFLNYSRIDTSNAGLPELKYNTDARLSHVRISVEEVSSILKSLNVSKASGPDGISPRMLRNTVDTISVSLTQLYNISLNLNTVPIIWKKANVTPIMKKGDPHSCDNYRPVSLLSVVNKILEKCICKYIYNHLRDNNLLSKFQSGFQPGDSTTRQLIHIYHLLCKALDERKHVRIVFGDISKAFDRVWHLGLIHKLKMAGITGDLNMWLENYLSNKEQRVVINGVSSNFGKIEAGVPQGSVLGPILFLVYINDITDNLKAGVSLFADDNMLYVISDNPAENYNILKADLELMENWAEQWLVSFSPKKTKDMSLSLRGSVIPDPLSFGGQQIQSVSEQKHLGVTLQSNLMWKSHVENICAGSNTRLNILKRFSKDFSRKTLETLYFSYILPAMEYCDILFDNCTAEEAALMDSVHYRAAKIVSGAIHRTPSKVVFLELGWKSLQNRRQDHKSQCSHDIVHMRIYLPQLGPVWEGIT